VRDFVKVLLFSFAQIIIFPLGAMYRVCRSRALFAGQGQLLALVPGKFGSYVRVAYYSKTLDRCPTKGYIGFGSFFSHPEVELGIGYYIGAYCIIGKSKIGDHATIASGVYILSGKHQHGYKEIGKPIQEQPGVFTQVSIGENCWIGNGAIIMDDLGVQNLVAAGSVVTHKTGDYEIVAGNPAKVIRSILPEDQQL
jgi:virginiamycin A acetyltransferase